MKFANQFREHEHFLTNGGNREKIVYGACYNDNGRLVIEEKGREDWYGYIQSHKDSVDIHVLLQKFQNGDTEVMNRVQGFYGDITGYPSTLAGALNIVRSGEDFFNSLPVDERAKYNHNFAEFLASFDTPDNLRRLFSSAAADVPDGVKSEPQIVEKKEEPKE